MPDQNYATHEERQPGPPSFGDGLASQPIHGAISEHFGQQSCGTAGVFIAAGARAAAVEAAKLQADLKVAQDEAATLRHDNAQLRVTVVRLEAQIGAAEDNKNLRLFAIFFGGIAVGEGFRMMCAGGDHAWSGFAFAIAGALFLFLGWYRAPKHEKSDSS